MDLWRENERYEDTNPDERIFTVTRGTAEQIEKAKQLIQQLIAPLSPANSIPVANDGQQRELGV